MIECIKGNIFKLRTEAIVNTVNCFGVMGRGLALEFKTRFPENYNEYRFACNKKNVRPGKMFVHIRKGNVLPKLIVNFPTKYDWRGNSYLCDIEAGLIDLVNVIESNKIKSIAIPALGCGLGGLSYSIVKPIIINHLKHLDNVNIYLLEPDFY